MDSKKGFSKIKQAALSATLVGGIAIAGNLASIAPAKADVGNTPIVGGVFNAGVVLKEQIVSTLGFSTTLTRDVALFTIAGVSLDAFILSLPLEAEVKGRVVAQLSNPRYAIPLGYFLYGFYDRYTGLESDDEFKQYLSTIYDENTLKAFEHSLYQVGNEPENKANAEDKSKSKNSSQEGSGHHEGIKVDRKFIASMVVIYDALVEIGEWQKLDTLPDRYTYLTNAPEDLAKVAKIQPIIIDLLSKTSGAMEEGEMKAAVLAVIEDGKAEHEGKVNNKAQALTATLIDFVRLNVLKAYRQFVFHDEREEALEEWMQNAFDDDANQLLSFLDSQQNRRFAVQVTVDGLQQGLMEGLVSPDKPFIPYAYSIHLQRAQLKPETENVNSPKHEQQVDFLRILAEQDYQDRHYLPFFKRLYSQHRDNIARVGVSSTPTISVRNLPIIKTGANVSGAKVSGSAVSEQKNPGTGIPNFHFVDREQDRAYYFFGNDALQLDRLMDEGGVQTMFDRLEYLNTLNCNAQYDWNAHTTYDGLVNLGLGEELRDYGEKRCVRELQKRAKVEGELRKKRQALIEDIRAYDQIFVLDIFTKLTKKWKIEKKITALAKLDGKGMPDYTLVYNPWPDHFAHFTGPFSDEIIMPTGELNRLDYWLGEIEKTYRNAGVYHKTLWGMAGDHGLTPTFYALNPEKQVFENLAKDLGYPLRVKKISSDEGEGPKITNALNYPSNKDIDVVVASTAGGNFMMDFFNAKAGWKTQPVYDELTQWKPIEAPDGTKIDVVSEIADRLAETLDYMVLREETCTLEQCKVRIVGTRNGVRLDETVTHNGDKLYYAAKDSSTPTLLEVQTLNPYLATPSESGLTRYTGLVQQCLKEAKQEDPSTWCDGATWRELTRFSTRPDAVNQIVHIYDEDRAGTINLFPKAGIGYNTKVPGRHAGEDYLEKDAFIGFWGSPVGENATPLTIEENGSLAPTLYQYLTGEKVVQGEDGWGYPSLLEKLDIKQ